ncbi:MAG TPA: ABC transporter ATP-binding protein, partial [Pseudogracilibacillus sp.]|nr:ABC transporter ATP-binding protein [Pseudogracilibacillus sp.]
HIMEVVENISNRIVLLVDGKIAADGTFAELKKQSQQGSLESIFNELTGFDAHNETATHFVDILTNKESVIHHE